MDESCRSSAGHRPFALVLGGGGARGFAHVGVLRGLEAAGFRPRAVVGVSMGAVVGVTYTHREDWYEALLAMDLSEFPGPTDSRQTNPMGSAIAGARRLASYVRTLKDMVVGWGPGTTAREAGLRELRRLLGGSPLESGRIPVAVSATDLQTGERVVMRRGDAVDAVYASAALAGVIPPLASGSTLLADGAYSDLAPVDVARELVEDPGSAVVAVDPGQASEGLDIGNGFQAIMRAMEICHRRHADLRFGEADLVLRPGFSRTVDTLDFRARRECVAAGLRVVRRDRSRLQSSTSTISLLIGTAQTRSTMFLSVSSSL